MALIGNGRAKYDAPPVPRLMSKEQSELAAPRDPDGRPHRDGISEILPRVSQTRDGTQQLKEIVAAVTQEPRAAINAIEQEIGSLRDMIAVREQILVEAIDQHATLSKEAVRGIGVVRQALAQIRDAFNAAMRPTPVLHQ
jgi:hypothetical protein